MESNSAERFKRKCPFLNNDEENFETMSKPKQFALNLKAEDSSSNTSSSADNDEDLIFYQNCSTGVFFLFKIHP